MYSLHFNNSKIGIFGLGKTGVYTIKKLLCTSAQLFVWDDNIHKVIQARKLFSNRQIVFSHTINHDSVRILSFVIISPGIPNKYPVPHKIFSICKHLKIPTLTDVDLLFQFYHKANFIGVTGTNGKSTTVSLIKTILEYNSQISALGGNIGIPVLSLPSFHNSNQHYILELSSYQLDIMRYYKFNVAVLLSITPDHLDRYHSFAEYRDQKIKIFYHQDRNDLAIISLNQSVNEVIYDQLIKDNKQTIVPISNKKIINNGISVLGSKVYDNYFEHQVFNIPFSEHLIGTHNAENIAVSYVVAKRLNFSSKKIINSLGIYKGLNHRMEQFLKINNLSFINDSKASNTYSTRMALDSYKNIHWIVGGIFKEKNTAPLNQVLNNVEHCYLIGRDYRKFLDLLETNKISYSINITIKNALIEIKNKVKYGTVLLSPCCSSFDQWKNFEERGLMYKKLVFKIFT